jgi:hypothetical protein
MARKRPARRKKSPETLVKASKSGSGRKRGPKPHLKAKNEDEAAVMSLFDYKFPAELCLLYSHIKAVMNSDQKRFPENTQKLLFDFIRRVFSEKDGHYLLVEFAKMIEQGPSPDPQRQLISWLSKCSWADTERGSYIPSKREIAKAVSTIQGKTWSAKSRIVDKQGKVIQKATADDEFLNSIEKHIDHLKEIEPDNPLV